MGGVLDVLRVAQLKPLCSRLNVSQVSLARVFKDWGRFSDFKDINLHHVWFYVMLSRSHSLCLLPLVLPSALD